MNGQTTTISRSSVIVWSYFRCQCKEKATKKRWQSLESLNQIVVNIINDYTTIANVEADGTFKQHTSQ